MTERDAGYQALLAAADPTQPRPLGELLARLAAAGRLLETGAPSDPRPTGRSITNLAYDSRVVRPGALFVAVPGDHVDGQDFVAAAAAAGAVAAIVEHRVDAPLPQIVVDRSLLALAVAACWWYGDPSADLGVVGITGTDGKTSTTHLAASVLDAAGVRAGIVSTVGGRVGGVSELDPPHATTPQALDLQRALAAMRRAGDPVALVETTSHALSLGRIDGVRYDIAILTNVTHEHLEFHGSWEAYRDAKVSLFERLAVDERNPAKPTPGWTRTGIVNADDPSAPVFAAATRHAGARVLTYGSAHGADFRLQGIDDDGRRLAIAWDGPDGRRSASLQLAGRFNAHNALATAALGHAIDLDPEAVTAGLERLTHVPGRMQRIDEGQPFGVVIDYAHTPTALALVLDELAMATRPRGGSLIAVFGSAGERDREKRPMMGRVAAERCRLVIVTDEDPRGEDPDEILHEIAAGATAAGAVPGRDLLEILDRHEAIATALAAARPGDSVLLAGKGHETTIIAAEGDRPWDEHQAALDGLAALGYRGPGNGGR